MFSCSTLSVNRGFRVETFSTLCRRLHIAPKVIVMGEDMSVYNVEELAEIKMLRKNAQMFRDVMRPCVVNPRSEGGRANIGLANRPRALSLHVLQRKILVAIRKNSDLSTVAYDMCQSS
jgi:hypothetical protein